MAIGTGRTKPRLGKSTERALDLCAELFARIEHDNALLRETLDNLTQGVVMFDASTTLVLSNDRYVEMYGLSKDVVKPGCTLRQLLEHRRETGTLPGEVDTYHDEILEQVRRKHRIYGSGGLPQPPHAAHAVEQGRGEPPIAEEMIVEEVKVPA